MGKDKPRVVGHAPAWLPLAQGTLAAPAPWGKLLPEFSHTDQGMLPDTRTNSEELQPNQTSSSGHLSECLQLPFPATKTLNIKQRELIYTWDIDTKQRRAEEKDKNEKKINQCVSPSCPASTCQTSEHGTKDAFGGAKCTEVLPCWLSALPR